MHMCVPAAAEMCVPAAAPPQIFGPVQSILKYHSTEEVRVYIEAGHVCIGTGFCRGRFVSGLSWLALRPFAAS